MTGYLLRRGRGDGTALHVYRMVAMAKKSVALLLLLLLLLFLIPVPAFAKGEYRDVTPDQRVALPGHLFYAGAYRIQWWYFTGHLYDERGREFGYELTFFAFGVQKRDYASEFGMRSLFISHFAVTDVAGKRYYFMDKADRGAFGFAGALKNRLKVWVGKNLLEGNGHKMRLSAEDGNLSLDLTLIPEKGAVLHGRGGYSRKSEESPLVASLYFSFTRMRTEGVLRIGSTDFRVGGTSWFDREISSRGLGENNAGWDWFALQLDDAREVMLYLMRNKDGSLDRYSSGTVVYRDGRYRHLSLQDFSITPLKRYTSKKTGARYPAQWRISVPSEGLLLTVTPLVEDQEFLGKQSTGNHYWEGTAAVEGTAAGRAYVELTGY
ncbi:MAG: carotenoid 1,2-hydratase [Alphaproteobacteria bacterium]|uniref:Carotenoid 1,2-hydratase n=1 Tax=Candidatus Nitrobium versatile TaxID=2884831 RepID=A0A953SDC9_9BACT|nr:carotenoid 1,2-hydratase [Candidatus Nitrobium versatile]